MTIDEAIADLRDEACDRPEFSRFAELIERQQQEIKSLGRLVDWYQKEHVEQQQEIERLGAVRDAKEAVINDQQQEIDRLRAKNDRRDND